MSPEHSLPRRRFLRGEFFTSLQSKTVQQQGFQGIRPPWAVDNQQFIEDCTRCGACIQACETRILVKGEGDFPEVHFDRGAGECTFCQRCVTVCPQPIFRPLTEPAWFHRVEVSEACLTKKGIECRSCEDSCEMRAIRFKPTLGQVSQISLNLEDCNGCGACLKSCPTFAIKIIYPDLVEQCKKI
ncbi:ferredoxin-type protein NapF [Conservatibacter flavescens]|uniref:Ferredoxin-type protein NapF n=1 Tax=Conservatibacter flavescens TaxID=28161 RepID=A0A2M8S4A3_9PAST|nr:ferredoxin-type protein NapF [Conservatibacter flavescens]PJG85979.1 ferredoxin-type protein NapF [Conservatibacter flavescens]